MQDSSGKWKRHWSFYTLLSQFYRKKKNHSGSHSNDCSFYSTASAAGQRLTKDCEWGFSFARNPSEQAEFSCKLLHVAQKMWEEKAQDKISQDYAKHPELQYTCVCLPAMLCMCTRTRAWRFPFGVPAMNISDVLHTHDILVYSCTVTWKKSDSTGLTGRCVNRDGSQPLTPPAVTYRAGFEATGSSLFEMKLKIYLSCRILCLFIGRFHRIPTVPKAAFLFVRLQPVWDNGDSVQRQ